MPPVIPPGRPPRSQSCLWWVLGGCALIVVVVVGGAAIGGAAIYNHFRQAGINCLASDFPTYPAATPGAFTYELNGTVPGSSCHIVFRSKDSTSAVLDFYESRLDTGGWQVTSSNRDIGLIAYRNAKRAKTNGTVQVAAKDGYTEITVEFYSP